jgi:hypothetical protein
MTILDELVIHGIALTVNVKFCISIRHFCLFWESFKQVYDEVAKERTHEKIVKYRDNGNGSDL